jgi:hypothetical protein
LSFAIWRDVRAMQLLPMTRTIVVLEGAAQTETLVKNLLGEQTEKEKA